MYVPMYIVQWIYICEKNWVKISILNNIWHVFQNMNYVKKRLLYQMQSNILISGMILPDNVNVADADEVNFGTGQ